MTTDYSDDESSDDSSDDSSGESHDDLAEALRRDWRERGPSWDRWADHIAELADRLNQPLIDAAGIAPGDEVLDLASGAGEPALSVARRVGPEGSVVATDLVPEMLAGAKRRASEAGVDNIRFELADMTDLPFPAGRFSHATCRFGIMFVPDAGAAMREIRRVLRPGGRAALLVWGPIEDVTVFRVLDEVVGRELGTSIADRPFTPFRFGAAGALGALFEEAGFVDVEERELRFSPKVPLGRPFWRPNLEMSFGSRLRDLSDDEREALDRKIAQAFAAFSDGEVYRLESHVRLGLGTAPA